MWDIVGEHACSTFKSQNNKIGNVIFEMRINKILLLGVVAGFLMTTPSNAQNWKKKQVKGTTYSVPVSVPTTKVQWEVTPKNCQVIIDGGKQKLSSMTGGLSAILSEGVHSYEVISEGYHTFKGKINTNRRKTINLIVKLRQSHVGGLDVAAFPDGVDIQFGDKKYKTFLSLDSVAEGDHQVSFSKEGYVAVDTTFAVRDGATNYYSVALYPKQVEKLMAESGKKEKKRKGQETPKSPKSEVSSPVVAVTRRCPSAFLLMAQAGYSNELSYGLMVGYVKANGFYVKAMSNFGPSSTDYVSDKAGMIQGGDGKSYAPYYTLDVKHANFAVSGGYLRRLTKPLLCYIGAGYGQQKLIWTTIDNQSVENQDLSKKGVAAEGGLILTLGKFSLSCGVQTINFATGEIQFGIGLAI